ncbi:cellulose 1,4-beta-cellobiosidase [Streptomyces roseirectus]|uniref:Cellulose 1,4-beta-cellobiosidase n=1 Tax=Streptomyces roseirectus TaxID=2768066 RepID=A0A7H0IQM4_9ACTN|nr:PA14 domain-containing protein [Streptomyces roseirectus]QNP75090.1 cellulose 1,4-beta-cellobiosidase [Streptomyces roseirectus]
MRISLGVTRRTAGAAVLSLATALTGLAFPATAQAAVTCAAGVWKAQYYANTALTGTPKGTVCDAAIAENYGLGDPAGVTLPRDRFGVRWTTTRNFGSGGPFDLTVAAQDGVRVYLDNSRKIDLWHDVSRTQKKTVRLTVPRGTHTLRVDFAAFTGAADIAFGYRPVTGAALDKTAPLAPSGVKAGYAAGTLRASLAWARNQELDLAGYRVYRRTGSTGAWSTLGSAPTTAAAFTDTPPATGAGYEYALRAVDRAGNLSPLSAPARVVSADRTAPAAPTGLTATYDDFGARLSWSEVSGASAYEVQRSLAPEGPFASIAVPTQSTALTDPGATVSTTYHYRVRALDDAGNTSPYSAPVRLDTPDPKPLAPAGVSANGWVDRNTVGWRYDGDDAHRFHVYAAESATGPWTRLTETPVTGRVYDDFTAPVRQVRHYQVRAVTARGTESDPSATASATRTGDVTPPHMPYGLDAWDGTDGVHLSWTANTDDTDHYLVLRKPMFGAWEQIAVVRGAAYLDAAVPADVRFGYTVRAVDAAGNVSPMPEPGYGTVYGKRLPVREKPAAPASVTATAANGNVTVEWTASTSADIAGYYVYRTTSPDPTSAYSVSPLLTGTTFTNENVPAGKTWFYVVRVVSKHSTWSDFSPVAEVTVPCPALTGPPTPRITGGGRGADFVQLNWEAGACDQGATVSYNVYRSTSASDVFTPERRIASGVTRPTYTDPGLARAYYYYVVTAVAADGTESAPQARPFEVSMMAP